MMKNVEIKKRDNEAKLNEADGTVAVGSLAIIGGLVVYTYSTAKGFLLESSSITKIITAHHAIVQHSSLSPGGLVVGALLLGSGMFITCKGSYDYAKATNHMRNEEDQTERTAPPEATEQVKHQRPPIRYKNEP